MERYLTRKLFILNIKREPKDSRFFCSLIYGAVAPMVERKPEELGVSGSSPLSTTKYGGVAQMEQSRRALV